MPPVTLLKPKGLTFTRVAIAQALAQPPTLTAADIASARWGALSAPAQILKGDVGALNTSDSADLQSFTGAAVEFFELVSALTIVGRIGARAVPLDTRLISMVAGAVAYWTQQGKGKALAAAPTFNATTLPPRKCVSMTVFTDELLRTSSPAAELFIRNELARVVAAEIDRAFIAPDNPGDDATPASVLNGIAGVVPATGGPGDDIKTILSHFVGNLEFAVWVMSPFTAGMLSSEANPNCGLRGGELVGAPVIASSNCPAGLIALIDSTAIAIAEGETNTRASKQASVEMSDTPSGDSAAPTAANLVSLWQTNSTAVLVEKSINWARLRDAAVKYAENLVWAIPIETT